MSGPKSSWRAIAGISSTRRLLFLTASQIEDIPLRADPVVRESLEPKDQRVRLHAATLAMGRTLRYSMSMRARPSASRRCDGRGHGLLPEVGAVKYEER